MSKAKKIYPEYNNWYDDVFKYSGCNAYDYRDVPTYVYLKEFCNNKSLNDLEKFLGGGTNWSVDFELGIIKYIEERKETLLKCWIEK